RDVLWLIRRRGGSACAPSWPGGCDGPTADALRGFSHARDRVMRRIRSIAGLTLVALGLVGIVLPLMPGVPLLLAGIALLGSDHPLRAIVERIRRRGRTGK